jgi:hypothetical protein
MIHKPLSPEHHLAMVAEKREAMTRGLIPDIEVRASEWTADQYSVAADLMDDRGYHLAAHDFRVVSESIIGRRRR